jgi:hypothetical protein
MFIISSCGSTTKVTGSWKNEPEKSYKFDKLAIVGITPNADGRKMVEEYIEDNLVEQGVNAVGALNFLPPNANQENTSIELLHEYLNIEKSDAVLTVSLLRTKDNKQYVSGSYYYVPWTQAQFGDYYGQMSNYLYAPGYQKISTTFFLESNLYSYPAGELLWSAQTVSTDVTDVKRGAQILAKVIVKQLFKDEVLEADK